MRRGRGAGGRRVKVTNVRDIEGLCLQLQLKLDLPCDVVVCRHTAGCAPRDAVPLRSLQELLSGGGNAAKVQVLPRDMFVAPPAGRSRLAAANAGAGDNNAGAGAGAGAGVGAGASAGAGAGVGAGEEGAPPRRSERGK